MTKNTQIKIFMDETGKNKNKISIFGGISIPINIYNYESIQLLENRLQKMELKFHFSEYNNYDLATYTELIDTFSTISQFITMNAIAWKQNDLASNLLTAGGIYSQNNYKEMVYSKIPERVAYGLLRNHSAFSTLVADLSIENSSEYQSIQLNDVIKTQVNVHALYRSDLFMINKSKLVPKNKQIGLEFTDMLIGMTAFIMEHAFSDTSVLSSRQKDKAELTLLALDKLDNIFSNINLFELSPKEQLEKIEFNTYIRLFKSNFSKQNNPVHSVPPK